MSMWMDISLQALMILGSAIMYLWIHNIPRKLLAKYHLYRDRSLHQSRRHFVKAAELLTKARSCPRSSPSSLSFAAAAAAEADAAVRLNPADAANHVVRALALDLQGYKTSALEAIEAALSPLAVSSLSDDEKADALVKRAELRMEVSRLGNSEGVDEAVWRKVEEELTEAVRLKRESERGWCLLGECCEGLGKRERAKEAFEEAVRVRPDSVAAKRGLERLGLGLGSDS